jgi:hypothetical protein
MFEDGGKYPTHHCRSQRYGGGANVRSRPVDTVAENRFARWSDRFLPAVSVLISLGVIAANARAIATVRRVGHEAGRFLLSIFQCLESPHHSQSVQLCALTSPMNALGVTAAVSEEPASPTLGVAVTGPVLSISVLSISVLSISVYRYRFYRYRFYRYRFYRYRFYRYRFIDIDKTSISQTPVFLLPHNIDIGFGEWMRPANPPPSDASLNRVPPPTGCAVSSVLAALNCCCCGSVLSTGGVCQKFFPTGCVHRSSNKCMPSMKMST